MKRCVWAEGDVKYKDYHDREWGVPIFDGRELFAKLILDGFQAGLSWSIILKKREHFYQAFDQFDPEKIAAYDPKKITELLNNPGIVRNKLKVNAAVSNARAFLAYEETGSFSDLLWSFTERKPKINRWKTLKQIPANSKESDEMSKALKKIGFKFVGTTICYAFMQAVGIINDHLVDCFRYNELSGKI